MLTADAAREECVVDVLAVRDNNTVSVANSADAFGPLLVARATAHTQIAASQDVTLVIDQLIQF